MGFGIITKKCEKCECEFRTSDDIRIIYCHDCALEEEECVDKYGCVLDEE